MHPPFPKPKPCSKPFEIVAGYPTNLIARLIYGCGLRVCEPLNLRIKDLNLDELTLFLVGRREAKTALSPA